MKEKMLAYLKSFQMLTDEEIHIIADSSEYLSCKKGDILLKEGQVASKCYFVLQGCIREYHIKNGIEKSTNFFTEGESVTAYSSVASSTPSRRYLECSEDCILTVGNKSAEEEMCELIPRLKSVLLQETERIAGKTQDEFADFLTSSPEDRYRTFLDQKGHLLNRVPQHQIASYLGITPESLSRIRKRIHNKKVK